MTARSIPNRRAQLQTDRSALPSSALVAGWGAGLALLPRLLPHPLAWLLLAAGTVFVAIVLSREATAWLQVVLGQVAL